MAAGRATYLVRITRAQGQVLITTSIDGAETSTRSLEATTQALRSAVQGVSRETKTYAATNNVDVDTEITNEIAGQVITFTVNPAGEIANQRNRQIAAPPPQRSAAAPARTAAKPAGQHRAASGFKPISALPSRPTPTAPSPEPEPEPEPTVAWADGSDYQDPEPDPEPIEPAPNLVPVTDRRVRIKKSAQGDGERGSLVSELVTKFKGLTTIKKIGVILAVVIVLFLGARIFGGGGKDYNALCVDQRTGLVNLDPAPCQNATVRFFVWYYVPSGETLPEPGTDYSTAPGSFDKPTSGTITYP